jgi:hypothetical protein
MKGFVSPKDKKQPMIIKPNSHGVGVLTCVADPDSLNPDPDPDSVNPDPAFKVNPYLVRIQELMTKNLKKQLKKDLSFLITYP